MVNVLFSARRQMWPEYEPVLKAAFAAEGVEVVLTDHTDAPETMDYLIYAPVRTDDDLSGFTNLKLIQSLWAGPDKLLRNTTLTQPLARMVDPGMTQGMVDYVMGHILRHHLGTDTYAQAAPGEWKADSAPPLAQDRTVAFLGIGALGMACARAARAHGFRVVGWSRRQKEGVEFACYSGPDGLRDALGQADIVVTLMPATPATDGILGAEAFGAMKDGAALINPGRGELVDDDALLAALDGGKLSGATLDVFRVEPLPTEHRYWSHPKVLVTPHIASETRVETSCAVVAANIARVERGETALYLVDPALKY